MVSLEVPMALAMTACPCCGAEVRADKPIVDLNTNTVTFNGRSAKLQPQEAEILSVIAARHPATVSRDYLIRRIWGALEPDNARNNISVRVTFMRKKLAPLGLGIKTVWRTGLRLDIPKEIPHAA